MGLANRLSTTVATLARSSVRLASASTMLAMIRIFSAWSGGILRSVSTLTVLPIIVESWVAGESFSENS